MSTMSIRASEEFLIEFRRWTDQYFKEWRDDIAARRQQVISLSSSPDNPSDHNHSINPHDSTTSKPIRSETPPSYKDPTTTTTQNKTQITIPTVASPQICPKPPPLATSSPNTHHRTASQPRPSTHQFNRPCRPNPPSSTQQLPSCNQPLPLTFQPPPQNKRFAFHRPSYRSPNHHPRCTANHRHRMSVSNPASVISQLAPTFKSRSSRFRILWFLKRKKRNFALFD